MSGQKDVLQRLKTALARSEGQIMPEYGPSESPLGRRNEAKRVLLRDAIVEIERLRAIIAEDERLELERVAKEFRMTDPRVRVSVPLCRQVGVAWSEVPP